MKKLLFLTLLCAAFGGSLFAQKSPSNPVGANITVADAGSCSTVNSFLWQQLPNNAGTTTVNLAGTFVATVTIRESNNGGGTWTTATTLSAAGTTTFATNGFTDICADVTAYTSGTVQVSLSTGLLQVQSVISSGSASSSASSQGYTIGLTGVNGCANAALVTCINGNGHVVTDVTSNSSTTITCPNNDCNFTSTDQYGRPNMVVGQKIWATTQGTTAGIGLLTYTTSVCPVTTVASFTAQSVTVNLACTANATANAVLIWGSDDGTTLHGMTLGCFTYNGPNNVFIIDSRGFFITQPPCATSGLASGTGFPEPNLYFWNNSISTVLVMTPDFVWADCTGTGAVSGGVCIGSGLGQVYGLLIWGTGLTSAANANCAAGAGKVVLAMQPNGGYLDVVNLSGICPGGTMVGAELNSLDEKWYGGGVQHVGTTALVVSALSVETELLDNHNINVSGGIGLSVLSGAQLEDHASNFIVGASISGTVSSHGTHWGKSGFGPASQVVTVNNGGFSAHDGDFFDNSGCNGALTVASGGIVALRNVKFACGPSGAAISNVGNIIDQGGNTLAGFAFFGAGGAIKGSQIVQGSCTGVVTSAATIGLFGAGQLAASTCTSTTVNLGQPMGASGTLTSLSCNSGVAGNQAADACTVVKNGAATAITCSMNAATFCRDTAHTVAYAAGDIIGIEVIAGTATTLSGVRAAVLAW